MFQRMILMLCSVIARNSKADTFGPITANRNTNYVNGNTGAHLLSELNRLQHESNNNAFLKNLSNIPEDARNLNYDSRSGAFTFTTENTRENPVSFKDNTPRNHIHENPVSFKDNTPRNHIHENPVASKNNVGVSTASTNNVKEITSHAHHPSDDIKKAAELTGVVVMLGSMFSNFNLSFKDWNFSLPEGFDEVSTILSKIQDFVVSVFNDLYIVFSYVFEGIVIRVSDAFEYLKPYFDQLTVYLQPVIDNVVNYFSNLMDLLKPYFDQLTVYLQPLIDNVVNYFSNLMDLLKPYFDQLIVYLQPVIDGFMDLFSDIASIFNSFIETVSLYSGILMNYLSNLIDIVSKYVMGLSLFSLEPLFIILTAIAVIFTIYFAFKATKKVVGDLKEAKSVEFVDSFEIEMNDKNSNESPVNSVKLPNSFEVEIGNQKSKSNNSSKKVKLQKSNTSRNEDKSREKDNYLLGLLFKPLKPKNIKSHVLKSKLI